MGSLNVVFWSGSYCSPLAPSFRRRRDDLAHTATRTRLGGPKAYGSLPLHFHAPVNARRDERDGLLHEPLWVQKLLCAKLGAERSGLLQELEQRPDEVPVSLGEQARTQGRHGGGDGLGETTEEQVAQDRKQRLHFAHPREDNRVGGERRRTGEERREAARAELGESLQGVRDVACWARLLHSDSGYDC